MEIVSITSRITNQFSYIYYTVTQQLRSKARDGELNKKVTTRFREGRQKVGQKFRLSKVYMSKQRALVSFLGSITIFCK
jgi:hypothetical protein